MKRVALSKATGNALSSRGKRSKVITVEGKPVPQFGGDLVLIRTARFKTARASTKPSEEARFLARRAGKALEKPGIKVSKKKKKRTLYSVAPGNPMRILRETADGKVTVGRLVGHAFKVDD